MGQRRCTAPMRRARLASQQLQITAFLPRSLAWLLLPFLLYVSDEGVPAGRRAYKCEQLFHGFTVSSLLDSLSWLPLWMSSTVRAAPGLAASRNCRVHSCLWAFVWCVCPPCYCRSVQVLPFPYGRAVIIVIMVPFDIHGALIVCKGLSETW